MPVIKAENLSKKYILDHRRREAYTTLRDRLTDCLGNMGRRLGKSFSGQTSLADGSQEEFWALKDVSFEINQGDRVGIIGRNGAGKSTLLKILSRITSPTSGSVSLRGRVASLLEVGTGFHPELTGRENIFLNGAILGMRRTEICKKFDEIVTFAEVEQFLDTPVKRYSSGMYVRLAFAVAAHLEPEILIVDEVLAVGDAQFQKKCLGKMEEVSAREGRTVLFVSHNMPAIESICTSAFYLKKGTIHRSGSADQVVKDYMKEMKTSASVGVSDRKDRVGRGMVVLKDLKTINTFGTNIFAIGEDIPISLLVENKYPHDVSVRLSVSIRHGSDFGLLACDTAMTAQEILLEKNSLTRATCRVIAPPLNYGEYFLNTSILYQDDTEDWLPSAGGFVIESGRFANHVRHFPFPVLAHFEWSLSEHCDG